MIRIIKIPFFIKRFGRVWCETCLARIIVSCDGSAAAEGGSRGRLPFSLSVRIGRCDGDDAREAERRIA